MKDFCGIHVTSLKDETIELINQHIKSYILYEGDMKNSLLNAIEKDPTCVMAKIMGASFFLSR